MKRILIALIAMALLVSACGGAADDTGSGSATETTQPVATSAPEATAPQPETSSATTHPAEESTPTTAPDDGGSSSTQPGDDSVPAAYPPQVDTAINDLAERIGVDPGSITVQSVEEVTWRDGSLGCPLPGMSYTQALVDGMRIVLEADGTLYNYHAGGSRDPFYCANPSEPLSGAAGGQ